MSNKLVSTDVWRAECGSRDIRDVARHSMKKHEYAAESAPDTCLEHILLRFCSIRTSLTFEFTEQLEGTCVGHMPKKDSLPFRVKWALLVW